MGLALVWQLSDGALWQQDDKDQYSTNIQLQL